MTRQELPIGNPENFKPDQTVSYSIPSNTNFKPSIVYLQGNWKNNPDNMELQSDTGRIALIYYAKSASIVAGGKGVGIVSNDNNKTCLKEEEKEEDMDKQQCELNSRQIKQFIGRRSYQLMVVSELTDKDCII